MDKKDTMKAYSAAIIFSILVGFSFLGIKVCMPIAGSLEILTYRYNFAFLALVVLLLTGIAKINLKGKPKKNLILTAFFYVAFMALQVVGMLFSTSIEASIIFAIVPIIAQIIAFLCLGEKSGVLQNIFVCLVIAALIVMIILSSGDLTLSIGGAAILLVSSICMAVSNVFMRYVRGQYKPIEITTAIVVGGFFVFNIITVVYQLYTGTLSEYFNPCRSMEFIIATAYLGIGCILISAQLISYMLSKMEAVKATIFGNVSTAISIVAGAVILGEPLRYYHIICTVVIVAGVIGLSMAGRKNAEERIS